MIDFDQELAETIFGFKGFYRRYSDDFIVVIPNSETCEPENIKNKIICMAETYDIKLKGIKQRFFYLMAEVFLKKLDNQYKTSTLTFLVFF